MFPSDRGGTFAVIGVVPEEVHPGHHQVTLHANHIKNARDPNTAYTFVGVVLRCRLTRLGPERAELDIDADGAALHAEAATLLCELRQRWPRDGSASTVPAPDAADRRRGGRPGGRHADRDAVIYRQAREEGKTNGELAAEHRLHKDSIRRIIRKQKPK
jgi:hypothetical protein